MQGRVTRMQQQDKGKRRPNRVWGKGIVLRLREYMCCMLLLA